MYMYGSVVRDAYSDVGRWFDKEGAMTSNTVLKVTLNKYTRVCRVALTSGATVVLTPGTMYVFPLP